MASKDTSKMTKQTLRLGVEILEEQLRQAGEQIAELKRRLKIAESLACECCGEIENEKGEFKTNGGRFVEEWQCFACPKCVPESFDIEAADELIEELQRLRQEAIEKPNYFVSDFER